MTDIDEIGAAVGAFIEAVDQLGKVTMQLDLPWDAAALLLAELRDARADEQKIEAVIETHVIRERRRLGIKGDTPVEGVGVVAVRGGTKRKNWDTAAVAAAIIDTHMGAGDGELPDPWDVRTWLLDVLHVDYARVGGLKSLGLRPEDFCTEEHGTPSVQITRSGR